MSLAGSYPGKNCREEKNSPPQAWRAASWAADGRQSRSLRRINVDNQTTSKVVTATFNGFELDDDHRRLDHRKLHALLQPLFWIPDDSTLEDIATRAANSWSFGLYAPDGGDLVGFCRLVTDRISFAYLSDVVIAEPLRNKGLGAFMVESVLGLPEIEKCNMMLTRAQAAVRVL